MIEALFWLYVVVACGGAVWLGYTVGNLQGDHPLHAMGMACILMGAALVWPLIAIYLMMDMLQHATSEETEIVFTPEEKDDEDDEE